MKILSLKICLTGKTSYIYENGNEARDVLGDPRLMTHVGRDKKIRSAPRTNQNAGFVTQLSEKKKKIIIITIIIIIIIIIITIINVLILFRYH